ncbi:MAG TPA: hypothetical protein VGY99_02680 [Candidatus Binataceae bacterium]|jgi:hypothetical protein|nr:hypothetical protein [Candidatus Binataceae bacterium]
MLAEWQIRQLLLIAPASGPPGKVRSLSGRLMLTECNVTPLAEIEEGGATGEASAAEA